MLKTVREKQLTLGRFVIEEENLVVVKQKAPSRNILAHNLFCLQLVLVPKTFN
jgi:hypothetical protein